jgi:Zn finger protein HypA/HybF involved in hydrogenase expression
MQMMEFEMFILTCPHCGFSKELDETSVPLTRTKATCPKCRLHFFYQETQSLTQTPPPHISPRVYARCEICGAENDHLANAALNDSVKCFNCGNDIPIKDDTGLPIESVKSTGIQLKNTGMPFIGVILIVSCLLPYLLLLMGYFFYGNVQSDKGWTLIPYLFIAGGIFIFNAFAGLPILIFVKFNSGFQKFSIATMYLVGAVTPGIFAIYLYLESAARRGH